MFKPNTAGSARTAARVSELLFEPRDELDPNVRRHRRAVSIVIFAYAVFLIPMSIYLLITVPQNFATISTGACVMLYLASYAISRSPLYALSVPVFLVALLGGVFVPVLITRDVEMAKASLPYLSLAYFVLQLIGTRKQIGLFLVSALAGIALCAHLLPPVPPQIWTNFGVLLFLVALVSAVGAALRNADVQAFADERTNSFVKSKMASLGEMSSGIAHEINNPLAVIAGTTERLKQRCDDGVLDTAELPEKLDRIMRMSTRINNIVKSLRTFSRDASDDPPAPVAVALLVSEMLELCRERIIRANVDLRVQEIDPAVVISVRAAEISQCLLNLVLNAFEAVQDKPVAWIEIGIARASDHHVQLIVTDSGSGISPSIATKMLQPFFTTKPAGKGTGLGLSITRGLVENHGGKLFYDGSHPNTRFVIELPR